MSKELAAAKRKYTIAYDRMINAALNPRVTPEQKAAIAAAADEAARAYDEAVWADLTGRPSTGGPSATITSETALARARLVHAVPDTLEPVSTDDVD